MYSPNEIAALEEARQACGTSEIARESEQIAGGWMSFAGEGSWANQACGLGLHGPISEADLDRLVTYYTSRGVEPQIEVCPFVHETLIIGLAERGFQLREFENVLYRELKADENLQTLYSHHFPEDLALTHVDPADAAQIESYANVSTQGFRAADEPLREVDAIATKKMVKHARCDAFLAKIGEVDAGGGAMESSGEIACLFSASVQCNYRRRGIQTALMIRRLERARDRGCSLAVVHSAPNKTTERNARRLGFTLAYTKVILVMPGRGLKPSQ